MIWLVTSPLMSVREWRSVRLVIITVSTIGNGNNNLCKLRWEWEATILLFEGDDDDVNGEHNNKTERHSGVWRLDAWCLNEGVDLVLSGILFCFSLSTLTPVYFFMRYVRRF